MRALVIDDLAKAEVKRVKDFSLKPENHYIADKTGFSFQRPPGDDPRHVAQLNTYRCVFSITEIDGKNWKHLSISIPNSGKTYANPIAAFSIAELFGFSGWDGHTTNSLPEDWAIKINQEEHCVVLAQEHLA